MSTGARRRRSVPRSSRICGRSRITRRWCSRLVPCTSTPQGGPRECSTVNRATDHGVARADPARPPAVHRRGRRVPTVGRALRAGSNARSLAARATDCSSSAPARSGPRCRRTSATGATSPRGSSRPSARIPISTPHHAPIPAPALDELEALAAAAPPMTGAEYLTASVLETLWTETADGVSLRARRIEGVGPGVSSAQEPGLASRRPRPFQPRREPPGR